MTPKYPGTLEDLLPKPPRPNDAWSRSDKPPIMARDIKPAWARGNIAGQKRPRRN